MRKDESNYGEKPLCLVVTQGHMYLNKPATFSCRFV